MDELTASYPLTYLKKQQFAHEREFQLQSLKLKREKDKATPNGIQTIIAEAAARTHHFQAQEDSRKLHRKVNLLRERHKLREEGCPLHAIDTLLPFTTPDFE